MLFYSNVGRRLTGELIYHEYNLLTEIAGGISVTMPFKQDFLSPETREYLEKFIVRNPALNAQDSIKLWKFVENVGASPMTAWYEIAGVHGGGSPIMETIALSIEYDFETRKNLAKYLAGIKEDFDDDEELKMEPNNIK